MDNDARSEIEDSESDTEVKNGAVMNGVINGKRKTQWFAFVLYHISVVKNDFVLTTFWRDFRKYSSQKCFNHNVQMHCAYYKVHTTRLFR